MKRILMISGKMGSGKSRNAHAITQLAINKDMVPRTFKFAEPLYAMHNACLPILKKYKVIPEDCTKLGELLQVLGTEFGRKRISDSIWVDCLKVSIDEWLALSDRNLAIVDDMRFPNEFEAFHNALRVRLICPESIRKSRCDAWREGYHLSEHALDDYEKDRKFDMHMDTEKLTLENCAQWIFDEWFYRTT